MPNPAPALPLVHIGYHKTGSTWLQRHLFQDEGCGFTNETGFKRHEIVHDFVRPDVFDFSAKHTRSRYAPLLERAGANGLIPVISHERLSGYPASGGYDRKLIADRLAETFPQARILVVLREQKSLIRSMYSQYITDGGDQSLRRFLETPEPGLGRKPYFRFSFYSFHTLIEYYQTLFGVDRVLALPFEMMTKDKEGFLNSITAFCGQRRVGPAVDNTSNPRRPNLMQSVQRYANRLFSHNELSPVSLVSIPQMPKRFGKLRLSFEKISPRLLEQRMERSVADRIAGVVGTRYAKSNMLTSRLIGINLADYGYPCLD